MGAVAGSVLRVIPLEAAEYAHNLIEAERAENGSYAPKFFDAHQYKTLQTLCETILPTDADCGGAIEAGAPEFIDLLTSENAEYQATLGGGMTGLDTDLHQPIWQSLSGLHAAATDRNSRSPRVSKKCRPGRQA